MTGRRLIATVVVLAGAVAAVYGAPSWASKPYYTWTDLELKEVLNNSPWADSGGISYVKTNGATSSPIEDQALVSWVSSLPLRQADVRQQLGVTTTPSKEADAYLAQQMNLYVVAVKVSGGNQSGSYATNVARAQSETFLLRNGKPPIAVAQVEGRQLDKDGKVIETPAPAPRGGAPGAAPAAPSAPAPGGQSSVQMQIIPAALQRGGGGGGGGFPGAPPGGAAGNRPRGVSSVLVYAFPKTDAITVADKEVEFVTKLCRPGGGGFGGGGGRGGAPGAAAGAPPAPSSGCDLNVKKKFKLKDMVYNGELAL